MAFAGAYNTGYEGLGMSEKWARILKGAAIATAGVAVGYYAAPKIKAFLLSKGFTPEVAADLANKVAAGTQKLPTDLDAEMRRTVPPTPTPVVPAWIWPVGIGALVIGGAFLMMPKRR